MKLDEYVGEEEFDMACEEDCAGALEAAARAADAWELAGDPGEEARARHVMAQAHLMRFNHLSDPVGGGATEGQPPTEQAREAVAAARRARALFRQATDLEGETGAVQTASRASLAAGDVREAARLAEEALQLARRAHDRQSEGAAQYLCAQMFAAQDRMAPAIRAAQAARELFQEHRDGENAALAAELLEALCEEQQLRGLSQNAQGRWVDERGAAQGSHRQGADGPRQLKEKELATLYNRTAFPWTLTQAEA